MLPADRDRARRPPSATSTTPRACAARPSVAQAQGRLAHRARAPARGARRRRRLVVRLGSGLAGRGSGCREPDLRRGAADRSPRTPSSPSQKGENSLDVAAGRRRSAPTRRAGSRRRQGLRRSTVLVSLGPAEVQIEQAHRQDRGRGPRHPAGECDLPVAEQNEEFFTDAAAGVVVGMMLDRAARRRRAGRLRRGLHRASGRLRDALGVARPRAGRQRRERRSRRAARSTDCEPRRSPARSDGGERHRRRGPGHPHRRSRRRRHGCVPATRSRSSCRAGPPLFPVPELVGLTPRSRRGERSTTGRASTYRRTTTLLGCRARRRSPRSSRRVPTAGTEHRAKGTRRSSSAINGAF